MHFISQSISLLIFSVFIETIDAFYTYNLSFSPLFEEEVMKNGGRIIDIDRFGFNLVVGECMRNERFEEEYVLKNKALIEEITKYGLFELKRLMEIVEAIRVERVKLYSKEYYTVPYIVKRGEVIPEELMKRSEHEYLRKRVRSHNFIETFLGRLVYLFRMRIAETEYFNQLEWIKKIFWFIEKLKKKDEFGVVKYFTDECDRSVKEVEKMVGYVEEMCGKNFDSSYFYEIHDSLFQ
jgi:hypothetical protein